jgi:enoyl-CoA hydratase/carnithine racemase
MEEAARVKHNRAINAAVDALGAAPMPTIAVINGLAMGGGCEIALACDLRYAAEDAQIGLTEARIGAIPGAGGTQRMPRAIGASRALELMLTGEPVSAKRAEEIGLVNAAVPADKLDAHVMRIATVLASRSPTGAQTIKRLVHRGIEGTLAEGLVQERAALLQILTSADYAEGLAAFAEKRQPRFGGGTAA